MMMISRHRVWALLFGLMIALGHGHLIAADDGPKGDIKPLTVYLVRHAEKDTKPVNPGLTAAGKARAQALADQLGEKPIDFVHSTRYVRTLQTAGPIVKRLGSKASFKLYDSRKLEAFASELKNSGGTHLVVGHSNSTPELIILLGGDPGEGMTEDTYDRLYTVIVSRSGEVTTLRSKYGVAKAAVITP